MKCSLLTLSCYLDDELEAARRGELEAHLVGCARCRAGLENLTEETRRIAALAPAHVPDHSVHALLEQLGLIGPDDPLPERDAVELDGWGPGGGAGAPPWQADRFPQPAPLTARRDDYLRRRSQAARESGEGDPGGSESGLEPGVEPSGVALGVARPRWPPAGGPSTSPQAALTPELPFPAPSIPTAAPVPHAVAAPASAVVPSAAAPSALASPAATSSAHASSALAGDPSVSSTWTSHSDADPWAAAPAAPELPPPAVDRSWEVDDLELDGDEPLGAPERAVRPGLLGRVRERVAMYRALSRGPLDDFDDSVQVVSGSGAPLRGSPFSPGRRSSRTGSRDAAILGAAGAAAAMDAGRVEADTHLLGNGRPIDGWTRPASRAPQADPAAPPAGTPLPGIAFPAPAGPPASGAPLPPPPHGFASPAAPAHQPSAPLWPLPQPPLRDEGAAGMTGRAGAPGSGSYVPGTQVPGAQVPGAQVPDPGTQVPGRIPGWGDAATSVPAPRSEPQNQPEWTPAVDYSLPRRPDAGGSADRRTAAAVAGRAPRRPLHRPEMPAAVAGMGRHAQRLRTQAPRRLLAALAAVALLTLVGLVTGRSVAPGVRSSTVATIHPAPAPAAGPAHSSSAPVIAVPPNPSAAAPSALPSAAPSAVAAPSAAPVATTAGLTDPHLLGDGASGYGLQGIRYGAHPSDFRVVLDLAASGSASGTPRAVVGTHDARTVWVELFGVGSGPLTQPDGTAVVTAVRQLPAGTVPGASVYALTLAHPVTLSAGYVLSPVRLVLDLH